MAGPGGPRGASAAEVEKLLDALGGRPRPAGGPAEAKARAHARAMLEHDGFIVREEPFTYSAFPGRWGTSLSGVAGIVLIWTAGHLGAHGSPWHALAVIVAGGGMIAAIATWLARRGVLDAPLMRRSGVNLVGRRGTTEPATHAASTGSREPAIWLMAHLDTKSQPIPILVRAAAISVSVVIFALAVALAVAQGLDVAGPRWWPALTIAGTLALLPVAASVVGARSDGAIDNASGCAAVLLAARSVGPGSPLGVILTSGEELGLAGGRAFARQHAPATCVNCDGVDDVGRWTAMYTGRSPHELIAGLRRATARIGMDVSPRRLLPGVLVDGVALADAGWQVITISHGSLRTLSRIHTERDSRAALRGDAIPAAAALIALVANEVR